MRYYSNTAAETTLTSSVSASTTTLPVASTSGFPITFPYTLGIDIGTVNEELVSVTAAAGFNLTVSRGIDNTTGKAHASAAEVRHVVSAQDFQESRNHEAATTNVHGVTGALVGATSTATFSNKSIDLGSNTLTGTRAQFNAALTDDNFATLAGTETLTAKTLTTPTINSPVINTPTINTTVAGVLATDPSWVAFALVNNWSNYGGGFQVARYRKVGGIVHIEGLVKNPVTASVQPGSVIATLPVGYRPALTLIFDGTGSDLKLGNSTQYSMRFDVQSDGVVGFLGFGNSATNIEYLSINCSFAVAA